MANLQYKNYIFDFYGTLVDIETDEKIPNYGRKWQNFIVLMELIILEQL